MTPTSRFDEDHDQGLGTTAGCVGCGAFLLVMILPVAVGIGPLLECLVWRPQRIQAAKDWVSTPCTILESQMDSRRNMRRTGRSDFAIIQYEYTVDGVAYRSNRLSLDPGRNANTVEWERGLVLKLQPGTATLCFVDPEDPTSAVLDREFSATSWLAGAAYIGFGALLATAIGLRLAIAIRKA